MNKSKCCNAEIIQARNEADMNPGPSQEWWDECAKCGKLCDIKRECEGCSWDHDCDKEHPDCDVMHVKPPHTCQSPNSNEGVEKDSKRYCVDCGNKCSNFTFYCNSCIESFNSTISWEKKFEALPWLRDGFVNQDMMKNFIQSLLTQARHEERKKKEINIGQLAVGVNEGEVWIQMPDGEGGRFNMKLFEDHILEFYNKYF